VTFSADICGSIGSTIVHSLWEWTWTVGADPRSCICGEIALSVEPQEGPSNRRSTALLLMVAAAMPQAVRPSSLFSPIKHRASSSKRNVRSVARAVLAVMKQELSAEALLRWQEKLDATLGDALFSTTKAPTDKQQAPPRPIGPVAMVSWVPKHPKVARLLLEAFLRGDDPLPDGKPSRIRTTTVDGRSLSKLMVKRAIEWVQHNHPGAFESTGELAAEQLADNGRLQRVVGRAATDLMAYLHSTATAMRDDEAVLELHRTDERLSGIDTRGSGLVVCDRGWSLFGRAVAKMIDSL
jgi:hypothetical protein